MEKYLYFQDGNDDAYAYPLDRFIGFVHNSNLTLLMKFLPFTDDADSIDTVTLAIPENKEKDAINDIVNLINKTPNKQNVITIADNVNQVYASTHVTDVSSVIDGD